MSTPEEEAPAPQRPADFGAQVHNHFHGQVNAAGAHFGLAAEPATGRRSNTGRLSAAETAELLRGYVRPEPYDRALRALREHGAVLLVGPADCGKRSGAVNLLRELGVDGLRLLSPVLPTEELARNAYEPRWGYVLLNRSEELTGGEQHDFGWRQVRDQVRACGAHLVVTATVDRLGSGAPASLAPVAWQAPDGAALLATALRLAGCAEETVAAALERRQPDATPGELTAVAARVAAGDDPRTVWAERTAALDPAVTQWFDTVETDRQRLAAAALAFVPGVGEREFERVLGLLEEAVAAGQAAETGEGERPDTTKLQLRGKVTEEGGLITTIRVVGVLPRTVVVFRRPAHRVQVLRELWQRYATEFWDGLRRWLDRLVAGADPELQVSVAAGLALLARAAFEEVLTEYLWPWSAGESTPAQALTATYTLWCMAMDDELAPAALDVARRWARDQDRGRRSLAALALGGELGVRFPAEAVRWIWHVASQEGGEELAAVEELGRLFAGLVEYGEDTRVVLGVVSARIAKYRRHPFGHRPKQLAWQAALVVLEAGEPERSAAGLLLCAERQSAGLRAERAELLAELWAATLDWVPAQGRARAALLRCLRTLDAVSPRPQADLELLGARLQERLSDRAWERLLHHLRRALEGRTGRLSKGDALHLLDALRRAGAGAR